MGAIVGACVIAANNLSAAVTLTEPYQYDFEDWTLGEGVPTTPSGTGTFANPRKTDIYGGSTLTYSVVTGVSDNAFQIVTKNGSSGNNKTSWYANAGTNFRNDGSFYLSADINVLTAQSGKAYRIGLSAFAGDSNPENGYGQVFVGLSNDGTVDIYNFANLTNTMFSEISRSTLFGALSTGAIYNASLAGTYTDNQWALTFTITQTDGDSADTNIGKTASLTALLDANYNGNYFGFGDWYHADYNGNGTALTVNIDNFYLGVLPIPEPSTWLMVGVGAGLLFFLRRRK
ncbi:MAG: PEP-CTERM sorting domain-containing protein [Verrucomicrobiales bacterium]|jgi:hypothetical protein|nr:PEP-CTERM sorting domain-containing protein [Verrucomicrobiales bacterium]